jgi:cytoskeleton protein RodZ
MSEVAGASDDLAMDLPLIRAPAAMIGPGASLRNAREAQGLHIGALAVTLKIPVKKLEALEADRYELLPDTVFVRALALSVCRVLKLDAGPVMAALPQLQAPAIKTDEVGLNARFKSTGSGFRIESVVQGMKPAVLAMLVLVVAIVVVFLWPTKGVREGVVLDQEPVDQALVAGQQQAVPGVPIHQDAALMVVPVQVRPSESAPANASAAPVSAIGTGLAIAAPASVGMTASSPLPESILTLQAQGESWIEVTDAQGNAQMRKTISAGEVLHVSGILPLSVVLGRADVITVLVRGKSLDVAAFSKGNVARFEVK